MFPPGARQSARLNIEETFSSQVWLLKQLHNGTSAWLTELMLTVTAATSRVISPPANSVNIPVIVPPQADNKVVFEQ